MTEDRMTTEWARGVLPLLVLAALSQSEAHGYLIAKRLSAIGFGEVKGGVLYPVLNRLERDGAVDARWLAGDGGPGRKSFRLTDAGRERFAGLSPQWDRFTRAIDAFLDMPAGDDRTESL